MGRLIDADALKNIIESEKNDNDEMCRMCIESTKEIIDEQSTAYDPDKVVEQLKNEQKFWEHAYDRDIGKEKVRSYAHAIEIVKGGGVDGKSSLSYGYAGIMFRLQLMPH